jgi:hypothetical protein
VSKQRTRLVAVVATLLVVAGLVTPLCVPAVHIDQATGDRIRPGMTLGEVAAVVGGPPGWYEGVRGMMVSGPPSKGYDPSWYGGRGVIVVRLDGDDRVAEAGFYPGQVTERSAVRWAAERWTRNALGTGRVDLADQAVGGVAFGLLLAGAAGLAALRCRSSGHAGAAYGLWVLGAAASFSLLVISASLVFEEQPREFQRQLFSWVGMSAGGLFTFAADGILCGRRKRAGSVAVPDPAGG